MNLKQLASILKTKTGDMYKAVEQSLLEFAPNEFEVKDGVVRHVDGTPALTKFVEMLEIDEQQAEVIFHQSGWTKPEELAEHLEGWPNSTDA